MSLPPGTILKGAAGLRSPDSALVSIENEQRACKRDWGKGRERDGQTARERESERERERERKKERAREREGYLTIYICGLEHGASSISHVISKEAVLTTVTALQA